MARSLPNLSPVGVPAGTPRGRRGARHGGPTGPVAVFRMLPHVHISVIGCGYLGAVHAACMAGLGHDVVGLDVDAAKVDRLGRGVAPFHEPGFEEVLTEALASGRLTFTTDPSAITECDLHFIAVGTPQRAKSYAADMTYVWSAVDTVLEHAKVPDGGPAVIVGKSTVPVGTAQAIADRVAGADLDAVVVWNPEFLREGFAVQDTTAPDRIVYGLPEDRERGEIGRAALDRVYAPILERGTPRLVVNYPTAELVKVAANSFLATKISFINSMAELCDATGGDVARLAEAIGHDERIGHKFLRAGIGFGGGCLPEGHPRVHGPRRRARRRPVADLPPRGRLDQPASARPRR